VQEECHATHWAHRQRKVRVAALVCSRRLLVWLLLFIRTFPPHVFFDQLGRTRLRNVLLSYAQRNAVVGYCQSMNYWAGLLLLYLDEEHAFWLIAVIVEEMLPEYFVPTLIGSQTDALVFIRMLEKKLPKVHHQLVHIVSEPAVLSIGTDWLMCLFSRSLPRETVFRVWDSFFFEGSKTLLRVAVAMLKQVEAPILMTTSVEQLLELLGETERTLFDADLLVKTALETMNPFSRKQIQTLREGSRPNLLKQIRSQRKTEATISLEASARYNIAELDELYDEFVEACDDSTCRTPLLEFGQFSVLIKRKLPKWSKFNAAIDSLFKVLAKRCTQTSHEQAPQAIDFASFIHGLSTFVRGTLSERIELCFALFDCDEDKAVDDVEFCTFLEASMNAFHPVLPLALGVSAHAVTQHSAHTPSVTACATTHAHRCRC
jgi:Ca2+-binding EF-hand superfamily protein